MTAKQPELQINTSLKNMGAFVKMLLTALAAMSLGGAGSYVGNKLKDSSTETRLEQLEQACGKYDVRLATSETRMEGLQSSYVDIKKDLADIRTMNTQILLELRKVNR